MKQQVINENTKVSQILDVVAADMEGETVMMRIDSGKYYGLDAIGSRIWELLAVPRSVSEVVDILGAEYNVEHDQCQNDVIEFLNYLRSAELINFD